jgi:hypothetical protein
VQKSSTAWLWNCIVGKHAEAMDAFPEPLFLARTPDDEAEAKNLSEIVPVVLAQTGFEETYSQCAWQKETEGTGLYGVFWDGRALNGMGDIKVRKINVLNFYSEPGVDDLQESRNVFHVKLVHKDMLEQQHRILDLYFNLARKFQPLESTLKLIMEKKRICSERIMKVLETRGFKERRCKSCGRPLPWNHPYGLCTKCHENQQA